MLSTGTSAAFLHPVEALHGDLGLVGPLDVVLALSYSGNTEELLLLIPSLKHRHVPVIGMGGNLKSKLAKECAAWLDAHVEKEAGDDLPAPTTSTTLALALGDAVALTLAKLRSFSTDGFALNHPGGSLGRRLLLKTEDAMIPHNKVACVSATAPLDIVIMEMTRHPKGCGVVVLEDSMTEEDLSSDLLSPPASLVASSDDASHEATNRVLGVITHGDIHRVLRAKVEIFEIKAADIMTHTPVTCAVHGLASEALKVMESSRKQPLPLLPVIDKEAGFRGVVTLKDLRELF
ncbi:hypothetical protein BDF14DRAFT_1875195 [Spinellus fusiger]|nr:hypothetical protein BDF14DRAFT_1875195 [Spinellus fusiger]